MKYELIKSEKVRYMRISDEWSRPRVRIKKNNKKPQWKMLKVNEEKDLTLSR